MKFNVFGNAVQKQFELMAKGDLFEVGLDKELLWQTYLSSFPEGTNPMYKERTEHDCNCCKNFIRDVGRVVAVGSNNELTSIWEIDIGDSHYQVVANALANLVKSGQIAHVFTHHSKTAGVAKTHQKLEDGTVVTWEHFFCDVPKKFVNIEPTTLSEIKATIDVFERGAEEITDAAIHTVLDMIQENSLYRGAEFKPGLESFLVLKKKYREAENKNIFLWKNYKESGARIRNTVIGTLLQDLSGDAVDIDHAVRSFEQKVAPTNYKRPTAVITKRMVDDALKTIKELGIDSAFNRRFATLEDLSINNVIYADRNAASIMKDNLAASLLSEVRETGDYTGAENLSIDDFIKKVVPKTQTMEVLFEGKHAANMVSLVAPQDEKAPNILRWDNNFSWSYRGNVTDSIKERVKKAGGNIEAYLRVSLAWYNYDDLDLHVIETDRNHIYYVSKRSRTGGFLDVDMNAGSGSTREAVENVAWVDPKTMLKGNYQIYVHNYNKREHTDGGFEVEIEVNGEIRVFSYDRQVTHHENIPVFAFIFDGRGVTSLEVGKNILDKRREQEIWNIKTGQFQKVSMLTLSPNHWDDNRYGNKHYLFMLENCKNDERPRGFYNEFLKPEFEKHRKVFEVLGDKTKCEMTDKQLSGVGFSSTKKDCVICRCNNRVYKVTF